MHMSAGCPDHVRDNTVYDNHMAALIEDTLPGLAHTSIMDSHLGRLVLPGAWTGAASAGRGVGEVSTWTWGSHNQSVQGAYATGSSSKDHHLGKTNRFQCSDVQNSHA